MPVVHHRLTEEVALLQYIARGPFAQFILLFSLVLVTMEKLHAMFRRSAKAEHSTQKNEAAQSELSASNDKLSGNNNIKGKRAVFSGLFGKSSKKETSVSAKEGEKRDFVSRVSHKLPLPLGVESHDQGSFTVNAESLANCDEKVGPLLQHEDLAESHNSKEEHCLFSILQTLPTTEDTSGEDSPPLHIKLLACNDNLLYLSYNSSKDNSEKLGARFCRSPKPALRFSVETDPLSEHSDLTDWSHNLFDNDFEKKPVAVPWELRANNDYRLSDCDAESDFEVKGQKDGDACGKIIQKKRAVSFRVKRTLPRMSKFSSHAQGSEQELITEDPMEMQEVQTNEECTFEVLPLEMAAYPTDVNSTETDEDAGLMDWWKTVEGWSEWNKTTNFREDEDELAFEAVADRVFMAARLFVSLFNQRGASLQCHIVELLALADTADSFHKKTVSAAVGGGVASVAGSIATITGLILAPFTFGTSTIVTAVGISVATAGSITSATANITDAVQSKMDRKKVEKMIQGYQDEIKDIRDCLEFMQEGMDTLQEWNFKEYSESVVNTGLSRNIKHVMKEGGRAGKALMINTERLISTVKVLGVAGGAAKAAKAVSITTGVMSALFLALDVFFLARDSNELHKGAKTKFASKIREVCKELQHGLLELNKVKTQLQKTMDGIEVEEYDNQGEEEEEENKYESDPVNLSLLEQELDQLEEKLDQKNREMNEKMNESKKDTIKKKKKDESNSEKENEIKNDKQNKK